MNTYVMGEIATLLAVAVLAGILIGWCIKSLIASSNARRVREYVARDVDDAAADVAHIQQTLTRREAQLKDATQEIQKMRGRDVSMKAGNTTQIDEINKLKNEIAIARQSLDRSRAEFNSYRNEKQTEIQSLGNKLASYQSGGSMHDDRMAESSETISALRTAVRENDKVIDSLRARIKEGDTTVENLRSQLKSSEANSRDAQQIKQTSELTVAKLNSELKTAVEQRDKYQRDYETTLETKNNEINKQQQKLGELGKVQTQLQKKEHEYNKLNKETREINTRSGAQVNELKQTIADKEAQQAESTKTIRRLQDDLTALENTNRALTQNAQKISRKLEDSQSLAKQVETNSAEVVALNDMLRDISSKRSLAQNRVTELETQLKAVATDTAANTRAQQKIASTTAMLQERDSTVTKLRHELEDVVDNRNRLNIELGELQTNNEKTKTTLLQQSEQQLAEMKVSNTAMLKEKDSTIVRLRNELEEVVDNRNRLNIELGELQTTSEKTKTTLLQQSEQQVAQMKNALNDRDKSFDKLRSDMDKMAGTRDHLTRELEKLQQHGSQLETFKSNMQTTVAQRDSELQQRKKAYEKLQQEFNQLASMRDDYELRINALKSDIQSQAQQIEAQKQQSSQEITKLQPEIATLRSKLSLANSEIQQLSSQLSNTAAVQLSVTEKDAVIQKLTVDLQDAKMIGNTAGEAAHDDAVRRVESLTSALKDRDDEISRLNAIVTDSRIGSKKYQSETSLLKQEVETQSALIKGLEEQAENTLLLHKKIAAQSTEIEDLRASLYQNNKEAATDDQTLEKLQVQLQQQNNETTGLHSQLTLAQQSLAQAEQKHQSNQNAIASQSNSQTAELNTLVTKLQNELKVRDSNIKTLQEQNTGLIEIKHKHEKLQRQLEQRDNELKSTRQQRSATQQRTTTASAPTTSSNTDSKPRVFVRPETNNGSTADSLAGTAAYHPKRKAAYTRDGYRVQRMDGKDNLTLLPGIDTAAERELNKHGVSEFEQISLWGKREIVHFSDRTGIDASQAESYDWPKLAKQILEGSYRRSSFKEKDSS